MKKHLVITLTLLSSSLSPCLALEKGFTSLFNGKDLNGWSKMGGKATFEVQDGAIVGTTAPLTPNTFLTTNKHYSNFDLRFDVKLDNDELNSGCQIRSNSSIDHYNGAVHGYQCEIESRNGSAGFIYDELRRGWLSKDRKDAIKNAAYKQGEWNSYRIVCHDDKIQTWVNGVAIAKVTDSLTSNGFIGLQVHSVLGAPNWSVRWRNIRIKEFPTQPQALTSLSDFTTEGNWTIDKQGDIQLKPRKGESGWQRFDSYLWLKEQHENFACSFEYRHPKGGNSGFYFRVADTANPVNTGIEVQILDSHGIHKKLTHHDCGGIINTRPASANTAKPALEWNKMKVRCEGNHLKVWLNGQKIQDMYLNKTPMKDRPKSGFIGFQDHGLPLQLRNITIEKI